MGLSKVNLGGFPQAFIKFNEQLDHFSRRITRNYHLLREWHTAYKLGLIQFNPDRPESKPILDLLVNETDALMTEWHPKHETKPENRLGQDPANRGG